jgi:hypothetical protein
VWCPHDGVMIAVDRVRAREPSLRSAAIGSLLFSLLFTVHHVLQGAGPVASSVPDVAAYNVAHRDALLASEVALALGLLAFIAFLAPLVALLRRTGQETTAASLLIAGTAFIALGFMSTAAETALIGVADGHDPGAVDALNELQGRIPVVWTVSALATAISLAALRTGLLPRWLGIGGLVLAAVFLLAGVSSLIGRTVEGGYSLIGVALFIVWMLALAACLWRAAPAHA